MAYVRFIVTNNLLEKKVTFTRVLKIILWYKKYLSDVSFEP